MGILPNRRSSISTEELIVRSRALEISDFTLSAPDYEPISCIGNMTLIAASPFSRKSMHVVPTLQDTHGFSIVSQDEVDNRFEFG